MARLLHAVAARLATGRTASSARHPGQGLSVPDCTPPIRYAGTLARKRTGSFRPDLADECEPRRAASMSSVDGSRIARVIFGFSVLVGYSLLAGLFVQPPKDCWP